MVSLVPYDPVWPSQFAHAAEELNGTDLFGWIEHIGSTAVPGLLAKPIIDIMAGVRRSEAKDDLVGLLATLGYHHRRDAFVDRETFRRDGGDGQRTHHLHVVAASDLSHHDLLFRDRLRREPALAAEYQSLKETLAARHSTDLDRRGYAGGKTDFVQRVVDAERAERGLAVGASVYSRVR